MQNLFTALITLVSISSYAATSLVKPPSTNYEARHDNDDGSISIIKPQFSNPEGEGSLFISTASTMDGLCKLYGFGKYRHNSMDSFTVNKNDLVRIGPNGAFSSYDYSAYYVGIASFSCAPSKGMPNPAQIVKNKSIFNNDDGTRTIKLPKFKINGVDHLISSSSNKDAICLIHGLGRYMSNSTQTFNPKNWMKLVRIQSNGTFASFDSSVGYSAISNLICKQ